MRRKGTTFLLILCLLFAAGCVGWLILGERPKTATLEHGWNLILVNREYRIPEGYSVELTELANGEMVDSRVYPDLQAMFDDARAEGVYPTVTAGYRTHEEQQRLMDAKIAAYEEEGLTASEAKREAEQWVAIPGASEHELGLALDINLESQYDDDGSVYDWLAENAWRYGFILRYPPDKTDITGISNEPWHYRYVGHAAAKEMWESGQCLEEYVAGVD